MRLTRLIGFWVGLWIVVAGALSEALAQDLAGSDLRLAYNNGLTVPVFVNGQGPFDFVVDTAASNTVIFENLSNRLMIGQEDGQDAVVIFGLREQTEKVHELESLTVNGFEKRNLRTIILPDWDVAGQDSPAGLLGMDFLSSFFVLFDLEESRFYISERDPKRRKSGAWTSTRLRSTDLGVLRTDLFLARISINGKPFLGLLDTGASHSLLSVKASQILGAIPPSVGSGRGAMVDAAGTSRPVFLVQVARMTIGRQRFPKWIFTVRELKIFRYLNAEYRTTAILGNDVLARQSFAIDFPGKKLWLRRRGPRSPARKRLLEPTFTL